MSAVKVAEEVKTIERRDAPVIPFLQIEGKRPPKDVYFAPRSFQTQTHRLMEHHAKNKSWLELPLKYMGVYFTHILKYWTPQEIKDYCSDNYYIESNILNLDTEEKFLIAIDLCKFNDCIIFVSVPMEIFLKNFPIFKNNKVYYSFEILPTNEQLLRFIEVVDSKTLYRSLNYTLFRAAERKDNAVIKKFSDLASASLLFEDFLTFIKIGDGVLTVDHLAVFDNFRDIRYPINHPPIPIRDEAVLKYILQNFTVEYLRFEAVDLESALMYEKWAREEKNRIYSEAGDKPSSVREEIKKYDPLSWFYYLYEPNTLSELDELPYARIFADKVTVKLKTVEMVDDFINKFVKFRESHGFIDNSIEINEHFGGYISNGKFHAVPHTTPKTSITLWIRKKELLDYYVQKVLKKYEAFKRDDLGDIGDDSAITTYRTYKKSREEKNAAKIAKYNDKVAEGKKAKEPKLGSITMKERKLKWNAFEMMTRFRIAYFGVEADEEYYKEICANLPTSAVIRYGYICKPAIRFLMEKYKSELAAKLRWYPWKLKYYYGLGGHQISNVQIMAYYPSFAMELKLKLVPVYHPEYTSGGEESCYLDNLEQAFEQFLAEYDFARKVERSYALKIYTKLRAEYSQNAHLIFKIIVKLL